MLLSVKTPKILSYSINFINPIKCANADIHTIIHNSLLNLSKKLKILHFGNISFTGLINIIKTSVNRDISQKVLYVSAGNKKTIPENKDRKTSNIFIYFIYLFIYNNYYSNLKASIGLSLAALYAGSIPNINQIQRENRKLVIIELVEIIAAIEK